MATSREVRVKLELTGSANDAPVELVGSGTVDLAAGRITLEVRESRPQLIFDPALAVLGLLGVVAFAATRSDGDPDDAIPASVRSRTDLVDEHGREAGAWRVVGEMTCAVDRIRLRGQLLDCRARLEPGERVVAVDAPFVSLLVPTDGDRASTIAAWSVRTGRGKVYLGTTSTAYSDLAGLAPSVVRIGMKDLGVRRERQEGGLESLELEAELAVRHLVAPVG